MNKKTAGVIGAGFLLGVLVAWWLGLFRHEAPPPPYTPPIVATKPASNPFITTQPTAVNVRMAVAPPVLPPVPASQSNPPPSAPQNYPTTPQSATIDDLRQQARVKAITNNLRQLATAASQYMLDKGVTSATYYDVVGPETDKYIRSVNPVMGEDYSGIFVSQTDTQVSIVAPDGTMVTFNM